MIGNMSSIDRVLRGALVAPVAVVVAILVGVDSATGLVLVAAAAVMVATAVSGFCPLYRLIRIDTRTAKLRLHRTHT